VLLIRAFQVYVVVPHEIRDKYQNEHIGGYLPSGVSSGIDESERVKQYEGEWEIHPAKDVGLREFKHIVKIHECVARNEKECVVRVPPVERVAHDSA